MENKVSELTDKIKEPKLSKRTTAIRSRSDNHGTETYDRQHMIAVAAYYLAEKRGFNGDDADAMKDWLEAEIEVNNALNGNGKKRVRSNSVKSLLEPVN